MYLKPNPYIAPIDLLTQEFSAQYTKERLCQKAKANGWEAVLDELGADEFRVCTKCGALMYQGYCRDNGRDYYCSDECLHKDFTDTEWTKECATNEDSYWTIWYDHPTC